MSEWQDISTAPKDGSWILVYSDGIIHQVRWYSSHMNMHHSWRTASVKARGITHATHWQPLPAPPKTL